MGDDFWKPLYTWSTEDTENTFQSQNTLPPDYGPEPYTSSNSVSYPLYTSIPQETTAFPPRHLGPETTASTPSMFYMLTITSVLLFVTVIILCLVIFAFGTLTGHCTLCCYSFTCIRIIRKTTSNNQGKANSNNSTPNSSGDASQALSKPATGGKTHKTKATKKSNKK